jgi:serine phosphatase RsbU (regulator of sigma subunit)
MERTLTAVGIGGFVWEADDVDASGVLHADRTALELLGLPPGPDGLPRPLLVRRLPPDVFGGFVRVWRLLQRQSRYSVFLRLSHPRGGARWVHSQGSRVRDDDGRVVRVVGVDRDPHPDEVTPSSMRLPDPARTQDAEMVQKVTGALAQAATVEEVTEALTGAGLMAAAGVQSVAVCREENGLVRLIGSRGISEEAVRALHLSRLDEPLPLSEAIRTQEAAFLTDRQAFLRRYPLLRRYVPEAEHTSYACLPLVAQGRAFGAVGLGYADKHVFTLAERAVLVTLSNTIAQSLQRALLYDKTRELAAEMQTSMLPAHLPQPAGLMLAARYRPAPFAHEVGGDWYDAIPLPGPGSRTALIVGDVQGHDVHAAALMGQLRTALRAYAAEGHPPAAVMARASAFLAELSTDRFATCVMAVIDTATEEAEVVRAGHHAPLVRHSDGSCRWHRVPGGLPLGPFPRHQYTATRIPLEPGATMLLCTDGLIESRTADLEHGKDLLLRALRAGPSRPEPLADHLLHSMAGHTDTDDDVAFLLAHHRIGRRSAPARLTLRIDPFRPDGLRTARALLRRRLRQWSLDHLGDRAALLATELITNALRHTSGPVGLTAVVLRREGRALRLEVGDTSSTPPHRLPSDENATVGRGMLLVEELADAWGVTPRGTGKSVWVEIRA